MQIKKSNITLFMLLLLFWYLFTCDLSLTNIIIGVIACIIITLISSKTFSEYKAHVIEIPNILIILKYFFKLIYEIYLSSFITMVRIIKKDQDLILVEVELEVTAPLIITIIANSITLTPGTMTVDSDENVLHVIAIKDDGMGGDGLRKDIKEKFEKHFISKG